MKRGYFWTYLLVGGAALGGAVLGRWGHQHGLIGMLLAGVACAALGLAAGALGHWLDEC